MPRAGGRIVDVATPLRLDVVEHPASVAAPTTTRATTQLDIARFKIDVRLLNRLDCSSPLSRSAFPIAQRVV